MIKKLLFVIAGLIGLFVMSNLFVAPMIVYLIVMVAIIVYAVFLV